MGLNQINRDFWVSETSQSFKTFFNTNNSGKGHWGITLANNPATIVAVKDTDTILAKIFTPDNILIVTGNMDMNIYQFLIMTSVMLNETGGSFNMAITEDGSCKYAFSYIPSIPKVSYNCSGKSPCSSLGNKTAYELFNDQTFLNVPARANMYKPKNMKDPAWQSYVYPVGEPTGTSTPRNGGKSNYIPCGLIAECDFFKFRGRGVIQLTGRSNYSNLLAYIQQNKVNIKMNDKSLAIVNGWGVNAIDNIATKITNTELDTLFSDTAISILVFKTHPSNKFLVQMYNVQTPNDFIDLANKYGTSIGGTSYGTLFTNRVFEIIQNVPNWLSNQANNQPYPTSSV